MASDFDAKAQAAQALVVHASAFDCVPSELSAALVSRELKKRFGQGEMVSGIEIVHTATGLSRGNATTFHAAVDGFHAAMTGELNASRRRVEETFNLPISPPRPDTWPKLPKAVGNVPVWNEGTGTYAMRFPGADAAAILSSWRYLRYRIPESCQDAPRPRLSVCLGLPDRLSTWKMMGLGAVFALAARFGWGCKLLHSQPGLFSGGVFSEEGPSEEDLAKGSFVTRSVAYGSREENFVRATCRGEEPGYVATPKMMVALALTVLRHRDKLPFQGGVVLPGALFGECQEAYDLLKKHDVVLALVDGDGNSSTADEAV